MLQNAKPGGRPRLALWLTWSIASAGGGLTGVILAGGSALASYVIVGFALQAPFGDDSSAWPYVVGVTLLITVAGVIFGACLAVPQMLVLRGRVQDVALWPAVSVAGWMIGATIVGFSAGLLTRDTRGMPSTNPLAWVAIIGGVGAAGLSTLGLCNTHRYTRPSSWLYHKGTPPLIAARIR